VATLEYTNINLVDLPSYTFSCVCVGEKLKFTVMYNTRSKLRLVQVNRDSGECILQSTYLYPMQPLEFNFNATRTGYLCKLGLYPKDFGVLSQDLLNWSESYFLSVSMKIADDGTE